ncbi:MAG: UvrD-helicase domain-containing protein, partial [Pseudomonadota bacterium]
MTNSPHAVDAQNAPDATGAMAPDGPGSASSALAATTALQRAASAPHACAWVSANAGAGKTHVLVQRVIRLLLSGTAPEKILSITYTRAAAAEMSTRIVRTLSTWAVSSDETLGNALAQSLGRPSTHEERATARDLFLAAIETPGGLKVQTIHAFCEKLLQRFPLEAGVTPQFSVIETAEQNRLMAEAIDTVLMGAGERGDEPDPCFGQSLAESLSAVADHKIDDGFQTLVGTLTAQRDQWLPAVDAALASGRAIAQDYAAVLKVPDLDVAATNKALADLLPGQGRAWLANLEATARGGSTNDIKVADAILPFLSENTLPEDADRAEITKNLFLTSKDEPRKNVVTKKLQTANPALGEELGALQREVLTLTQRRAAQELGRASLALLHVANAVTAHYTQFKGSKGVLDYADLITGTHRLLETAGEARWVLFKLDESLEHVLVDEAQDTGQQQWEIIGSLVDEYFSGRSEDQPVRTVFAVGDEKQSIYSFQGARPELFQEFRSRFGALAGRGGVEFADTRLQLSFRSAPLILQLVDAVFAGRDIGFGTAADVRHVARRDAQGGLIEVWPQLPPAQATIQSGIAPQDQNAADAISPELTIARGVAQTIGSWLAEKRLLTNASRAVRPGDIMILLANRGALARALVRELKAANIPVAGADRLRLMDQLAVQDLLSVCRFALLPEDDLALAEALKSPLFDCSDDDLLALRHAMGAGNTGANGRSGAHAPVQGPVTRGTYWRLLLATEHMVDRHGGYRPPENSTSGANGQPRMIMSDETAHRLAAAARQLRAVRDRADFSPPYEFLHQLLAENDNHQRMLRRLGPDAGDAIDELLALAMAFDDANVPSLQNFLTYVEDAAPEIKREMSGEADEVRIMTIHGAKGLEAPIVILPDTARPSGENNRVPKIDYVTAQLPVADEPAVGAINRTDHRDLDQDPNRRLGTAATSAPLPLWQLSPWKSQAPIAVAAQAKRNELAAAEKLRLLYVALTRAEDEIHIGGFANQRSGTQSTWYELIVDALTSPTFANATTTVPDTEPVAKVWADALAQHASSAGADTGAQSDVGDASDEAVGETGLPAPSVIRIATRGKPDKQRHETGAESGPTDLPTWLGQTPPAERPFLLPVSPSVLVPLDHADAQVALGDGDAPAIAPETLEPGFAARRGDVMHALLQSLPDLAGERWEDICTAVLTQELPGATSAQIARATREVIDVLQQPELAEIFGANSRAEVGIVQQIEPDAGGQPIVINGQIDRLHIGQYA